MLVRCIYASRSKTPVTEALLTSILDQSRANNARTGVTGLLCAANDTFVQALEGGRPAVSALMAKILRDERHLGVELLSLEEIPERRFANWSMGRINTASINPGHILRFSDTVELNPFNTPASTTLAFLLDVAESGAFA